MQESILLEPLYGRKKASVPPSCLVFLESAGDEGWSEKGAEVTLCHPQKFSGPPVVTGCLGNQEQSLCPL